MSGQIAPMLSSLVPTAQGKRLTVEQTVAQVVEQDVAIRPRQAPAQSTAYLGVAEGDWSWRELRDYVIRMIERLHGPTPRQAAYKEQAIFEGFVKRHGAYAAPIARYAFETAGGYWKNAPVSVNRFCANSDPYFANPIRHNLEQVSPVGS